ncbi:MAG: glycosyl hydrolase [Dysgonamonadaceae bacterium]|nr:glycosyl hydrolase [Dysgonamonadaceae bacterium]
MLHTALKTATDLDIDIGIFNSLGWSQSGGPWVKPEESMRYLTSSELNVTGPQKLNQQLDKTHEVFQDVKVAAWPVNKINEIMCNENAKISSDPHIANIRTAFDGNRETGIIISKEKPTTIDIVVEDKFVVRSLTIELKETSIRASGVFQARENSKDKFKTIRQFEINRTNLALNVGFIPYAPISSISLGKVEAKKFRIILDSEREDIEIAEIKLESTPVLRTTVKRNLPKCGKHHLLIGMLIYGQIKQRLMT